MKFFNNAIMMLVRGQSLKAEINGCISADVLAAIYREGLFKLFVPEGMGGVMMTLPDAVELFEEASYIDGAFGWLVTIGSGGGYFAGIFEKDVSQRLFGPPNAVVAGSGFVGGKAEKTTTGYRVSGSWRYCSGADFATIFTANARLEDGSERSFIFMPEQVTVHRDWDASGLKATGSHTISVADAIVTEDMTFDIARGNRIYDNPIFEYPFLPFAEASFAAVNIGICRHYIEESKVVSSIYGKSQDPLIQKRYARVNQVINDQAKILDEEADKFHETIGRLWELAVHKGHRTVNYEAVTHHARKVSATALECAQRMYPYLGLTAAMESTDLNRCWRDLHTASQHVLLKGF